MQQARLLQDMLHLNNTVVRCAKTKLDIIVPAAFMTATGYPCQEFCEMIGVEMMRRNSDIIYSGTGVSGAIFHSQVNWMDSQRQVVSMWENVFTSEVNTC